jgi:hypothetical protein
LACYFTYRLTDTNINFYSNNGITANTDGTEYNPNENNDWATVIKSIKVEAAVKKLSKIAICISVDLDSDVPKDIPIEKYTIGNGKGLTLIGYNSSTNKLTLTKFDYTKNVLIRPLTDFSFDSGAASINDFCTHLVRDLYIGYMDSVETRESMQYLVSSMGGPKITLSGERKYVGSAIPLNKLSTINMDQITRIMSCSHPAHTNIYALMTLCTSSDSERGMCTLKSVSLNEGLSVTESTYDIVASGGVSTMILDTTASISVDLNTIDDYWAKNAKLNLKYRYW